MVPLVGTWIEIKERRQFVNEAFVVPLVGTWIEITHICLPELTDRRAPRGHVD